MLASTVLVSIPSWSIGYGEETSPSLDRLRPSATRGLTAMLKGLVRLAALFQ
ncbi:hypothetical protein [Spirulina sp. 06S082]|uniref:hypothetical protein n=1 Tax=Spirulina sp. 06S082 TaxID=3110248 RepID=UPI002B1ED0B5|nr:hypothetical protein [Spirulina sp. 06S082]MEA5470797.1 hypothetical protein [Spirulina sp. 06S082]